jgi:tetratricopeptide (TPR) repeat protein
MTRSFATHTPMGRKNLARILSLALPVALIACGGDEPASGVPEAVARTVASASVTPATAVEIKTLGGTVPTPPTYESASDAYKGGDFRAAAVMYRSAVVTTPEDVHGQYMLGLSSWKSGDFSGAKEAFDKAIALDPRFAKAYFNQARVLLDLKRAPEALEMIEKGRAIDSTSSDVWRLTARARAESGDVDGAIATYRDLLGRNEADSWGLNNLGMLLLQRGDVEGSLGPLARAVQVQPTAPLFLNNLGMALERSGHPVAALRRYELAVQHDASYVKAVRNVERLKGLVTDSTLVDEVNVKALAEQFRQTVRAWKVEVPKS